MVNTELLYVEPQFRKLGIATQLKIALENGQNYECKANKQYNS